MAKYGLVFCAIFAALVLVGGLLSIIGNPANGDTWSYNSKEWGFYVDSSRQPMTLEKHLSKRGGVISLGHIYYVWNRY